MQSASSILLLLSASVLSVNVYADSACDDFSTDMTCFNNGTVADANQVNANFKALLDRIAQLEAQLANGTPPISASSGATTYVRWGRTSCPGTASVVYSGFAAGGHYQQGGASSTVCLTDTPTFNDAYVSDRNENGAIIHGTEYGTSIYGISTFTDLHNHDAPCVLCLPQASVSVMIPGTRQCPSGWNQEYEGFLMGGHYTHKPSGDFVCVDIAPETILTGQSPADTNGNLWYPTEASCGALPCPPYVQDRELSCVVCSR